MSKFNARLLGWALDMWDSRLCVCVSVQCVCAIQDFVAGPGWDTERRVYFLKDAWFVGEA